MSATRDEAREAVARAIACGLGDDFDHAFVTKAEWTQARGEKGGRARDINEPMQGDYLDAADAALAAAEQAGWRLVPVEATEEMVRAAYEVGRRWLTDRGKPRAAWGDLGSDERWFMRQCARAILACEPTAKP